MKIELKLTLALAMIALVVTTVLAADGDLDTTFDADGKVVTDISGGVNEARGIAVQPDGKIVAIGSEGVGLGYVAVCRYNPDGSLDTSFDGDGIATSASVPAMSATGRAVALQPDGKIVVIGIGRPVGQFDFDFMLFRFNPNGSLDTTFDSDGVVASRFSTLDDQANAVALQPDGKILVGGLTFDVTNSYSLARYNSNGSLDTSFDGDGKVTTTFASGGAGITSVMLMSDGRIVAAGARNMARYMPNGSLDPTFGGGGRVLINVNSISILAAALQSDGKIIFGGTGIGTTPADGGNDFAVGRIDASGFFDPSFDSDGRNFVNFGNVSASGNSLVIQADGKIVIAGALGSVSDRVFALARLNASGSVDTSFGTDGKVTTDFPGPSDVANAIAIQSDGKLVVAGQTGVGTPPPDFAIARYQNSAIAPTEAPFDFDGDGRTDVSVFRPSDGNWHINGSQDGYINRLWGASGDRVVAADYDGDNLTDVAVFRPSDGHWYILRSSDGTFSDIVWGVASDKTVAADYDNDGKADIAVYRPSDGNWHIRRSADGGYINRVWGGDPADVPVVGDFDNDGTSDTSVFRAGTWHINRSTEGYTSVIWGVASDRVVNADYDGDGKDDVAVWRPSDGNWHILRSSDGGYTNAVWGIGTDVPVPGDYDGDNKADIAAIHDGTWHINQSTSGYKAVLWGVTSDVAIPGRY